MYVVNKGFLGYQMDTRPLSRAILARVCYYKMFVFMLTKVFIFKRHFFVNHSEFVLTALFLLKTNNEMATATVSKH